MRRVLVTRPQPAASETARRLRALGFVPVVLPLQEIRGLDLDGAGIPARAGAVALTSANAVRNAPPGLVRLFAATRCFAVGGATASLARAAGFRHVMEGPGDADGLARALVAERIDGPVVYLCGRVRRQAFEERLDAAGIAVIPVETYDTVSVDPGSDSIASVLGGQGVDAALIYSAEAATAFMELARKPDLVRLFETTVLCCLSSRIAAALEAGPPAKIRVAAEPTEGALLSLLGKPG